MTSTSTGALPPSGRAITTPSRGGRLQIGMAEFKSKSAADFIPESVAGLLRNQHRSHNAAPLLAGLLLQSEPQNEPERKAPRPSSPGPCRLTTTAICRRIFTPARPDNPAASVGDFCSGVTTHHLTSPSGPSCVSERTPEPTMKSECATVPGSTNVSPWS